jgi:diphthamide synthase (EF-2-diphthine--ammonia ligase)
MLQAGMKAMIVGVYSDGLGREWLGRMLDRATVDQLSAIAQARGMNVSGEGGEYETLVLDSPMHSFPLVPKDVQVEFRRDSGQLSIGRLSISER